ncbi:DUF1641 domain-containing protein [Natrinema gelatinilyticum]|uniref:DUF1641 domain-containing protein n=1 Tax=Natrinema gelatinilyticum TaxID=2961571 RepID=UPI0020C56DB6|nr:DUF1641 domain-containing protein [Natrinema gelatinilyticum]
MSDDTVREPDDLEAVIAANPEGVANFVRRLDSVNELLDVLALGESALTDEMVVELADTGSTILESADGLATDETVVLAEQIGANGSELQDAIETLLRLQRSGTLDELAELAEVGSLLTAALDDEMVTTLVGTGESLGEVAETAADTDTSAGLEMLLDGIGTAERGDIDPIGPVGMVRGLRDPDVQYGLGYLLAVARAIGREQDRTESA